MLDAPNVGAALWDWSGRPFDEATSEPFVDLNDDDILDFGFVTDAYRDVVVEVWVSDADGGHRPVAVVPNPGVANGRVVGRYTVGRRGNWREIAYDFAQQHAPISDRRYGLAPDTTAADGGALLYVYDQPDGLHRADMDNRLPPRPDGYVQATDVSGIRWAFGVPPDSLAETLQQLNDEMNETLPSVSLVTRPRRYGPLRTAPELLLARSAPERARLWVSVLN